MRERISCFTLLISILLLAGCAETPMGPTVQVLPGPNKTLSSFQSDQSICRGFAEQAVRDQAQNANVRILGVAALTTALGAGLGSVVAVVRELVRPAARSLAPGWAR